MSTQHANLAVAAAPAAVRRLLLDPLALPAWNPAFHSVQGSPQPAPGLRYAIRVRPGLSGSLEYTRIGPDRVDITWHVPGFRETGSWTLEPHGTGTLAHHQFEHTGPLASALRHAYQGVALLRLQRLAQQLQA
ncbi:MAG: SRPBCC family protein [Acidimicrobiales bacterium]